VIDSGIITVCDYKGNRDIAIGRPTTSLAEAVKGAQVIIIPLPAIAHENFARELAPYLTAGQVVYLPPGTFGSYVFAQAMHSAGNTEDASFSVLGMLEFIDWGTVTFSLTPPNICPEPLIRVFLPQKLRI